MGLLDPTGYETSVFTGTATRPRHDPFPRVSDRSSVEARHGAAVAGVIGDGWPQEGAEAPHLSLTGYEVGPRLPISTAIELSLNLASAVDHASANGADVANITMGTYNTPLSGWLEFDNPQVRQAFVNARERGTVIVASAGNSGDDTPEYPAAYEREVISVAAVGAEQGQLVRAPYSQENEYVDFTAYGGLGGQPEADTRNSVPVVGPEERNWAAGTSFSAPVVSGAAARIRAVLPDSTPEQVERILAAAATDLGDRGPDMWYGKHGYIGPAEVELAVRIAEGIRAAQ